MIQFPLSTAHCVLSLSLFQGIERLKGEQARWEKTSCWEAMKSAFGGPFSPSWLSPFSDLRCKRDPNDHVVLPQGEIIEDDVIEIPLV